jgi:hypothetical protein
LNHDGIVDFTLTTQLVYGRGDRCSVVAKPETSQNTENKIWGNEMLKLKGLPNSTFIGAPDFNAGFVVDNKGATAQPAGAKVMVKLESVIGTGDGTYRSIVGAWANHGQGVTNRFLAFAFTIDGQTHFGWARMDTGGFSACSARLTGYAYETVPGKALRTGQTSDDASDETANLLLPGNNDSPKPGTLGALSLGWNGLAIWRRPEEMS